MGQSNLQGCLLDSGYILLVYAFSVLDHSKASFKQNQPTTNHNLNWTVVGKLHLLSLLLEPLVMPLVQQITYCNEFYMPMKWEFFECSISWAQILAIIV